MIEIRDLTDEEIKYARYSIHMGQYLGTGTVCDSVREVYEICGKISDQELKSEIRERCVTIIALAKRMSKKLENYKKGNII
jgi:hypothetical protein